MTITHHLKSLDRFDIKGRGTVYIVNNPAACNNWKHLQNHIITIDGTTFRALGIECFAHAAPWRGGEQIGILVGPV